MLFAGVSIGFATLGKGWSPQRKKGHCFGKTCTRTPCSLWLEALCLYGFVALHFSVLESIPTSTLVENGKPSDGSAYGNFSVVF